MLLPRTPHQQRRRRELRLTLRQGQRSLCGGHQLLGLDDAGGIRLQHALRHPRPRGRRRRCGASRAAAAAAVASAAGSSTGGRHHHPG